MDTCPNCKRTLLSHASVRCNWCGAEIADESYQQKAAQERAAFRAHEAERDAIEAARSAAGAFSPITGGWNGPLAAGRILGNSWQRRRQMEAELKAQQRAMEEFAATGQGGMNPPPQVPQASQNWHGAPGPAPDPNSAPQAQAEEEAPKQEDEVRSMFRHLEL